MRYREYSRGIRLSGTFMNSIGTNLPSKRGVVRDFRASARARLAWVYIQGPWRSMITLTYHKDFPDFRTSKLHLNIVLNKLRRLGVRYLWVVEFQARGVPHYHIWMDRVFDDCPLNFDLMGVDSWRPIAKKWLSATKQDLDSDCVNFTMHQRSYVNWKVNIKSNYAVKYASKAEQKGLPVGIDRFGRWWGCSRSLALEIIDIKTKEVENKNDNNDTILGWNKFRRSVKKYLKKKFRVDFPHDLIGANLPIKWIMGPEHVFSISRLSMYYLVNYSVMSIDGKRKLF